MSDPTNAQITRTLAEKVMGFRLFDEPDGYGIVDDQGKVPSFSPLDDRNSLVEVLAKLTPEQWFEVNRSLPTIYSIRSDASPRHGFSWWLLTCDPAIIARAVAEVVGK